MTLGYKNVVNSVVDRQKAAIALIGATDGGIWNCEEPSMALRFAQAAKDKVPEVSIFVLRADEPGFNDSGQCPGPNINSTWGNGGVKHANMDGQQVCACSNKYFPYTKAWLAGKSVFPEEEQTTVPALPLKTDGEDGDFSARAEGRKIPPLEAQPPAAAAARDDPGGPRTVLAWWG